MSDYHPLHIPTCLIASFRVSPQVNAELVTRLKADENDIESYFSTHLKPDKLNKYIDQLSDIRELTSSTEWVLKSDLGQGATLFLSG